MAKPISELMNTLSKADQAIVGAKAAEMITALRLAKLRKQLGFTQAQVAGAMHIKQPTVAQMEKRADIQLSTLRQYVQVLGANLEINATLPDGSRINLTN
jgi:transcriptional regulator with XRE-family HTH domain